jgi:hypothetical protein
MAPVPIHGNPFNSLSVWNANSLVPKLRGFGRRPAVRAGRGFQGADVAEILSEAGAERAALPDLISVD